MAELLRILKKLPEDANLYDLKLKLIENCIFGSDIQEIAVQLSLDNVTFAEAAAPAKYEFNADTGNRIRIDFDPAEAAYVKVIFTMNSSSRTGGAQAAEICVY